MPVFAGFVGGSYVGRSVSANTQRTVNLYPEADESQGGKSNLVLHGTPGLKLLGTIPGSGGIRPGGLYETTTGARFVVRGNTAYPLVPTLSNGRVTAVAADPAFGTLATSSGTLSITDNGEEVLIVDDNQGYWANATTLASLTTLTNGVDFPGNVPRIGFIDGYFAAQKRSTNQWYLSKLYAPTFDLADVASAESSPDRLFSLQTHRGEVWLFGDRSTEVWGNTGAIDFPFQRNAAVQLPVGILAPHSVVASPTALYWLGNDTMGHTACWTTEGYGLRRISTPAIERIWATYDSLTDAYAFGYYEEGHWFYLLTFPLAPSTPTTTWCYDPTIGLWHERAYRNPSTGNLERWRGAAYLRVSRTHLIGDYANGNIYGLDLDTYTDNGDPIQRLRRAPYIADDLQPLRHLRFQLDMEVGVGLNVAAGQPGYDPLMTLKWSDDGGNTFTSGQTKAAGRYQQWGTRVLWTRLGASRSRVYEVSTTDPVKQAWFNAHLTVG